MTDIKKDSTNDIEIRTLPKKVLYHWELSGNHNLKSAIIHNISINNNSDYPIDIQEVTIEALEGGSPVQQTSIGTDKLNAIAQYLHGAQKQGVIDAYDFVFRPDIMFGDTKTLSPGTTIESGQSLFIPSQPVLVSENCEKVRITAQASYKGQKINPTKELTLTEYKTKNDYRLPVEGTWYISAGADLFSEHRWVICQEFGHDMVRLGENGGMHTGNGRYVESYYGYGKDVLAASPGTVVKAVDEFTDSVARLPNEGESNEEYWKRLIATSSEMLIGEPARGAGNYVLIQHTGEEFSLYGHLKPGSVRVEEGERVVAGDVIGCLGHSGNSGFPHLHFHVCDGDDFMYARSLPVKFNNISVLHRPCLTGYLHTGDIVKTKEKP